MIGWCLVGALGYFIIGGTTAGFANYFNDEEDEELRTMSAALCVLFWPILLPLGAATASSKLMTKRLRERAEAKRLPKATMRLVP